MQKKQRPNHKQLVKAGKMAQEMLIKKGFQKKETFAEMFKDMEKPPILPGLPEYLPHKWTITTSANIVYNLLKVWSEKNKENKARAESFPEFITFAVGELNKIEAKFDKEVNETPKKIKELADKIPTLSEIFAPLNNRTNTHAINKFLVDSFAVSKIVKMNDSTGKYTNWFLNEWLPTLYKIWQEKQK
jgi:hypothetical protein